MINISDSGLFDSHEKWHDGVIDSQAFIDILLESGDLKFVTVENLLREANIINK